MVHEQLKLVELTFDMKSQFLAFADELKANGDDISQWLFDFHPRNFTGYVEKLQNWKHGHNLPAGWMPSPTSWLVRH